MHSLFGAKALLLDLDNTLYDYGPCHAAGLSAAAKCASRHQGLFENEDAFKAAYLSARELVKNLNPNQAASHSRLLYFQHLVQSRLGALNSLLVLELTAAYWDNFIACMRPAPGLHDFLASCKARQIKLAILTDMTAELQHRKIVRLELDGIIDLLVSSEEIGAEKPDRAGLLWALKQLSLAPQQTCVIGDDLQRDIALARALGAKSIYLRRGENQHQPSVAPDFEISDFTELLE